jgi:hypothetical protein
MWHKLGLEIQFSILVVLLAILKLGAAFLLLGSSSPLERLKALPFDHVNSPNFRPSHRYFGLDCGRSHSMLTTSMNTLGCRLVTISLCH